MHKLYSFSVLVLIFMCLCVRGKCQIFSVQQWCVLSNIPNPAPAGLLAYEKYYDATANTVLDQMERSASDAVVNISTNITAGVSRSGTGFFIRTHPDSPFICMLTAGHNLLLNNAPAPGSLSLSGVVFAYRRITPEASPYSYDINMKEIGSNMVGVIGAQNIVGDNGRHQTDYALLAVPRNLVPFGQMITELPYAFLEQPPPVPALLENSFFSLGHSLKLPQRLLEISSAYNDVARNSHSITKLTNVPYWDVQYNSHGGFTFGQSGAPFISPQLGSPRVIGIMTDGVFDPLTAADEPNAAVRALVLARPTIAIRGSIFPLKTLKYLIRQKCGCSDEEGAVVKTYIPHPIIIKKRIAFPSAAATLATTTSGVTTFHNLGDIEVNTVIEDTKLNISATDGDIICNTCDIKPSLYTEVNFDVYPAISASSSSFAARNTTVTDDVPATKELAAPAAVTSVRIYPTITRGTFMIDAGGSKLPYSIIMTDTDGRLIFADPNYSAGNRALDVTSKIITNGVYIITIQFKGSAFKNSWKILIKK